MFALLADQLALRQVLAEVLLDDAAHDLLEPLHVPLDLAEHECHCLGQRARRRIHSGAERVLGG
jgi:hypothetical protein